MNDKQARLLEKTDRLIEAAKGKSSQGGLWMYTDPDGKEFYLMEKLTGAVRSPYSGKSFKANPVRSTMTDVGKNIKEEKNKKV